MAYPNIGGTDIEGVQRMTMAQDSRVLESVIPRKDGTTFDSAPAMAAKVITMKGNIVKADNATFLTSMRAFEALLAGGNQKLYLEANKYRNVQKSNFSWQYLDESIRSAAYTVQFICGDPFLYHDTVPVDYDDLTPASPDTITITSGQLTGNVPTPPFFAITPSGGNLTSFEIHNTNANINKKIIYSGTVAAGDTLAINCYNKTVLNNGVSDLDNVTYDFFNLYPGENNALTLTYAGGATGGDFDTSWYNIWY